MPRVLQRPIGGVVKLNGNSVTSLTYLHKSTRESELTKRRIIFPKLTQSVFLAIRPVPTPFHLFQPSFKKYDCTDPPTNAFCFLLRFLMHQVRLNLKASYSILTHIAPLRLPHHTVKQRLPSLSTMDGTEWLYYISTTQNSFLRYITNCSRL